MTMHDHGMNCNRPQLLRGLPKRIAAAIALILCLQLVVGCGQIYRARWPEEGRPDMKQVTTDIEADIKTIDGVTRATVGLSEDGLNFNGVAVRVWHDSTDPQVLKQFANDIEKRVAPTLVALRDDGDLMVAVKSADSETMPYKEYNPDHGFIVSWDRLAKIYGLKRRNPWRR